MAEKVGIALLGLGRIGQVHLNIIIAHPKVNLIWIVEENEVFANQVLEGLGLAGQFKVVVNTQLTDVLEDPRVQGVYVCTPTSTHTALVRQCLKAGKQVFCEKPLSENLPDIVACFDDAEKYGAQLMIGFCRHMDPAIRSIYNKARSGDIGQLYTIKSTFRDAPLWIGAHGLSQTFLSHDVGLITWFADDLPETVVCMASAHIKEVAAQNDVDTVVAVMKYSSGLIGIVEFSRYSPYGYDIRLEVSGSKGMQMVDAKPITCVKSYHIDGRQEAPMHASFPDRLHDAYQAELCHFIDVVQGNKEPEIKRGFVERTAIVINAIQESYSTGKIVHVKK